MIISTITGNDSITLERVKKHLNITFNDDDNYLTELINVSLNAVENYCRTQFIKRENEENIGKFSTGNLPLLLTTSSTITPNNGFIDIVYTDAVEETLNVPIRNLYTLSDNNYIYTQNHIVITLKETLKVDDTEDVVLKWATGMATNIEEAVQQARLLLIGNYYENRESVKSGVTVNELPNGVVYLLESYLTPQLG